MCKLGGAIGSSLLILAKELEHLCGNKFGHE